MAPMASTPSGQHVFIFRRQRSGGITLTSDAQRPDPDASAQENGVAAADLADRYRLLVELSPDAIVVHQFGTIRWMNPAGLRYLEASDESQVVGHLITEFIHPDSITEMISRITGLTTHGAVSAPSEAIVLTLHGGRIPAEAVSVRTLWNGEPAFQVILRDLTEHKAAQDALRYQAALVNHVSDAIVGVTADGYISAWNPAAERIYRRRPAEVIGQPLSVGLGVPCDPPSIIAAGGRIRDTHVQADGGLLYVAVSASQMNDGWVLVCSDQTAIRQAEQHFTTVVESLSEGVVVLDHTGRITSVNPSAQRMFDLCVGARIHDGRQPYTVLARDGRPVDPGDHPIAAASRTGRTSSAVAGVERRRDGRHFWISLTAARLNPGDPQSPVVATFSDITDPYEAGLQLEHAATHDELTGLPTKALFLARLDAELVRQPREQLTVLFIDLDDFKTVNDTHGHAIGDQVLRAVADRLTRVLGHTSTVSRAGGDEFVAIVVGDAVSIPLLRVALTEPYDIEGRSLVARASVGTVEVPENGEISAHQIVEAADVEMYRFKPGRRRWSAEPSPQPPHGDDYTSR